MKHSVFSLIVLALVVSVSAAGVAMADSAGEEGRSSSGEAWRRDAVWDDGKAEFCIYEVTWPRYGELRQGRAQTILVKEPWEPGLDVKSDRPGDDSFDVLKLNLIRDVATGVYTYHQMASSFLHRDSGKLRKLVTTSSEGCGISTAQLKGGVLNTRSYFDGQGERTMPFPTRALAEDSLPATLRDWVIGPLPQQVEIFPSLLEGRLPALESRTFEVTRQPVDSEELPSAGASAVEIRLTADKEWRSFLFARDVPHRLLRYRSSDGTEYRAVKCERLAYWQLTGVDDETWIPEHLRQ